MKIRCPLIVALLSGALLLAIAGSATAEDSEIELWLDQVGPEMTVSLTQQIERDTTRKLAPMVERQLLAAARLGTVSVGPPPASLALAVDSDAGSPPAPPSSLVCVVRDDSSTACLVRPGY